MEKSRYSQRLETSRKDPVSAVTELKALLQVSDPVGMLFFCAPDYPLNSLAKALNEAFDFPVVGCTTAGQIGSRYFERSIVALVLSKAVFGVHTILIEDLDVFTDLDAAVVCEETRDSWNHTEKPSPDNCFGFLLSDAAAMREEILISALQESTDIPLFGGSSAASKDLGPAMIFANGRFQSNVAVLTLIKTDLPYTIFNTQHFEPTEQELVITEAQSDKRLVTEISGGLPAMEYALLAGLDGENLQAEDFILKPLMIQIGNEWHVRSVLSVNADQSLYFCCAIGEGLPMNIGIGKDMTIELQRSLTNVTQQFASVEFILGCDCFLRSIEMRKKGKVTQVEAILGDYSFVGFNSFGEQYKGVNVNQTLTGVVVGHLK